MPDYNLFASEAGVTNRQLIQALKIAYPHYSKATNSMVGNPGRCAVRLTDEAESILRTAYGEHPGLASKPRRKKAARPNRTKPQRLVVYLTDEEAAAVRSLMTRHSIPSQQEFLHILVRNILLEELEVLA